MHVTSQNTKLKSAFTFITLESMWTQLKNGLRPSNPFDVATRY